MAAEILDINPYIRLATRSVIPAKGEVRRRIIFDYELVFIERGAFTLRYAGQAYRCTEGHFLLLRPGITHSFSEIFTDLSQPHIHFDITASPMSAQIPVSFKDLPELTSHERAMIREDVFAGYPKTPHISFADRGEALSLFYAVVGDSGLSPLGRKAKLVALIDRMITDNFPKFFTDEEPQYGIARQLKDYIDAGQGFTGDLSDLEKRFSYSKYYLERKFRAQYGVSLIAYRNQRRLEEARMLLQTKSVSAAAEELGFSSLSVFSRSFRRYWGYPPAAYKTGEKKIDRTT